MSNSPGVYSALNDSAGTPQIPSMTTVGLVMIAPTDSFVRKVKTITGGSDELQEMYGDAKVGYDNYVACKLIADSTKCKVYNIPSSESGQLLQAKVSITNQSGGKLIDVIAKKPGSDMNYYSVLVTKANESTFSLHVIDIQADVVERIDGISYDRYSNSFFERVSSEYVKLVKSSTYDTAIVGGTAAQGEYKLSGGSDLTISYNVADVVKAIEELAKYDIHEASILASPCISHLPEVVAAYLTNCPEDGVVSAIVFPPKEVVDAADVVDWHNGEYNPGGGE
jgi:hypothetical protein